MCLEQTQHQRGQKYEGAISVFSCTLGEGLRFAAADFELVMSVKELPLAALVPRCRGVILALSGLSLSGGVVLCWFLEVETIAASLDDGSFRILDINGLHGRLDEPGETTASN